MCDHDGEAADGTEKGAVNPVGPGKAGGVSDSRWGVGALTGAAGRASESGERAAGKCGAWVRESPGPRDSRRGTCPR